MGTEVALSEEAGTVALDGERRLPARGAVVRVVDGPRVLYLDEAF